MSLSSAAGLVNRNQQVRRDQSIIDLFEYGDSARGIVRVFRYGWHR
jgi:hypothetical protein